jgi:N-acyl-D-amino-acid deacylase
MLDDDLRRIMAQPWTMTSSDGQLVVPDGSVVHPRAYGPFPRRIRRYVMENKVTSLEQAIRSMSGLPAAVFRLRDRGLIRAGSVADIVVFDLETFTDLATFEQPHQYSTGVRHVLVNGQLALTEGRLTDVRAGRVLVRTSR